MKSLWNNGKYLLAYTLPFATFMGLYRGGPATWYAVAFGFGVIPLLELLLPYSKKNWDEPTELKRSTSRFFDVLLYLNLPILYGLLFFFLYRVTTTELLPYELMGLTLSMGLCLGVIGINVAHELGHRTAPFERVLAKLLLLPNNYMHFIIEHNRGHHKNVSTPLDPASADYGETLYAFYLRTVPGSYRSARELEKMRLERAGLRFWSFRNEMIRFALFQFLFAAGILFLFGWKGLFLYALASLIGILLLETVNYVEHYGLRRREVAPGIYEKVKPSHSWNSDHELGRIFLYELTRHSDHHYKAQRKYQVLRHFDESPQLPTGYPGCMVLALVPPLWFAVMNPRVNAVKDRPEATLTPI